MLETLINHLKVIPKEWVVFIVSALPLSELRGGIPIGLAFGFTWQKALLFSLAGNLLPILPVLLLLEPVSEKLRRFRLWRRFFDWLFAKTKQKAELIQKYEAIGLALFVAVPLPMTGAWSGAIAASLFKIKLRYAFWAIALGVLGAGIIVTILCLTGKIIVQQYF
jgi:uncharacterized membrane protein